ncbi:uncharacterized protein BP5553_04883 [Venustampulla echinocandica]|uniref:Uncharacterized protein n=1 Tax=Venustampulla echinocandica TaxID=2656787 RepID=A0A370TPK1_9HELO|nr:uncharacterized protein BP5553_04883 [Venustampulla echinocandica]RDL37450.1 hypothetical protein BP5553_04883 [Venustampulla echinocandica]
MKPLSAKKFAQMALFDDDDDENGPRAIPPTYRAPLPVPRIVKKHKKSKPEDFVVCDDSSEGEPETNWGNQPPASPIGNDDIIRHFPQSNDPEEDDEPEEPHDVTMEFVNHVERLVNDSTASSNEELAEDGIMASESSAPAKHKRGTNRHAITTGIRKRKYSWKDGSAPKRRLGHVKYPEGHKFAKFNKGAKKAAKVKAQDKPKSKAAKASDDEDSDEDDWEVEGGLVWDTDSEEDEDEDDTPEMHVAPILA